ncbi:MAG: hypothetical protein WCK34_15520 [Bacteroidota bacterium]
MKKIIVLTMCICLLAGITNGQKMYLRFGLGGGPGLKQYNGTEWADNTYTGTADNYVIKSEGLGGGLNANLAFGFMMSKYIGFDIGFNTFVGLSKTANYSSSSGGGSSSAEAKVSGMMVQIVPAIVITPGLEKINPYARIGLIVAPLSKVVEKGTSNSSGSVYKSTSSSSSAVKLYGGLAVGFTAAGGADFNLGKRIAIYAELVYNGITYAPSKGKYTEMTINGVDKLPSATTKQKEWTFEKEFNSNETIPDGSPNKQAKISFNFSNVELNAGIKIKLK